MTTPAPDPITPARVLVGRGGWAAVHPAPVHLDDSRDDGGRGLRPGGADLPPSAAVLRAGLAMSELDVTDLYVGYLTVGGGMSLPQVSAVLRGERQVSAVEHDHLAQALNDYFTGRGQNHPVAYAEDLADPRQPVTGPAGPGGGAPTPITWLHAPVDVEENTVVATGYRELLRQAVSQDPEATVGVVAGLSWSVTDEHELLEFLERTVTLATTLIGAADGAGVTANVGGAPFTAVSSDGGVLTVDEAQYVAGDGPCLHAMRSGTVVHADLATVRARWPEFAPAAQEGGVQEFLAAPLGEGQQWLGALNLYSTDGAGFTPRDSVLLRLLVSNATRSVQDYARLRAAHDLAAQLREAMASRAPIEQAKGILMAAHGLDADAAFNLLRTRSQHTNTKLHELARTFLADHTGQPTTNRPG